LEKEEILAKSQQAPAIAVHTIFRPISHQEPINRDAPISEKKLKGEGTPSERKIAFMHQNQQNILTCRQIKSIEQGH